MDDIQFDSVVTSAFYCDSAKIAYAVGIWSQRGCIQTTIEHKPN